LLSGAKTGLRLAKIPVTTDIRGMQIREWEERYRSAERPNENFNAVATPLLVKTAAQLKPGKALDLACGTGRNAIWLAEHGWSVTAVDGAATAIKVLQRRASSRGVSIDVQIADLEKHEYSIAPAAWDFVAVCYYLQRDLFEAAKQGLAPGGVLLAIVHIARPGEQPTAHRLRAGELPGYFQGWEILHYYEGQPHDAAHRRWVAEIVARRPVHHAEK
jgi:tellurite methyltransferase